MGKNLRLSKNCIKVLYDNLTKKQKLILKTIGDLDVGSKTDIKNTIRQRFKENDVSANPDQYWFDIGLYNLDAVLFVSSTKSSTKVIRRLTDEGVYAYTKFILEIDNVNDTALL